MRQREPFIRKQCPPHRWNLTSTTYNDITIEIRRACIECKRRERTETFTVFVDGVPRSLLHLADLDWRAA